MKFFLLKRSARQDNKIPLDASDKHPGCVLVNCESCDTHGVWPKNKADRVDIEVVIRDVAHLDDIEQAFTTLLGSQTVQEVVNHNNLTGMEFYSPLGYSIDTTKQGAEQMVAQCRDELRFQVMHVVGRGGSIAESSDVHLAKSCSLCGWEEWSQPENGIIVDESQWDGSDFFYVNEFGAMLMSERAVDILPSARLCNYGDSPAEEFQPAFGV